MNTVIGAGMAGLLAAAMLRSDCNEVLERQNALPNNHSAVLRFRSSVVGDALGIPFKRVSVMKASQPWTNPIADALAYSAKTNGTYRLRSSVTAKGEIDERYVAPTDLIARMARCVSCPFVFNYEVTAESIQDLRNSGSNIISTLPMPVMMRLLGWEPKSQFRWVSGYNLSFRIEGLDAYSSLYVPDPDMFAARISTTGDLVTAECPMPNVSEKVVDAEIATLMEVSGALNDQIARVLQYMGMDKAVPLDVSLRKQTYAKILPIDERERQDFIMWASKHHRVFSLGRFATWKPGLLLDDVVNDVRVIQRLIHSGSTYEYVKRAS
jgi:hypothetical protein